MFTISGMVYKASGSSCPKHCYDLGKPKDDGCIETQVEGCHCPDGKVLHNGTCIERKVLCILLFLILTLKS